MTKIIRLFKKEGCAPCGALDMTFKMVEKELNELGAEVVRHNIDTDPELIEKYGLSSVPVTVVESNGEEVTRYRGMYDVMELVKFIRD